MRNFAIFVFLAMMSAAALAAPAQPDGKPNVLLITLDTTRADHLGCYGYAKPTTPNLDRLAKEGALFLSAFSSTPLTLPSHASILTGQYPFHTGVRDNALHRLPETAETLAAIFKKNGYATMAFVSAAVLDRTFGLDRGFDLYDDNVRVGRPEAFNYEERAASQVNIAVLAGMTKVTRPFFVWVHYYDPHLPYVPPRPFDKQFQDAPYDGEIAFMDWAAGKLMDALNARKLLDNTIVVVAGDHGEGLGDHGEKAHGVFLYDPLMHVPLIIRYPGNIPAGKRVQGIARLVDVFPTVLDYAGIKAAAKPDGVSLRSAVATGRTGVQEVYQESLMPENSYGWSPLFGLRTPLWHFILAPQEELYGLATDPRESKNVSREKARVAAGLARRLSAYPYRASVSTPAEVTPELKEQIESLGYISSSSSKKTRSGLDPKEGIALLNMADRAKELAGSNRTDEAVELLNDVLKRNPGNVDAHAKLGNIFMGQKKYRQAQEEFEAALRTREFDYLYFDLGNAQLAQGLSDAAARSYRKAIDLNPRTVDAYRSLAKVQAAGGDIKSASDTLDLALSRKIRDADLFVLRGRLATLADDPSGAAKFLQEALEQNPDNPEAHTGLGALYFQMNRIEDSISEYQQVLSVNPNDIPTLKTMGSLYLVNKNDPARARPYFEKALSLDPDAPDAGRLREILDGMPR